MNNQDNDGQSANYSHQCIEDNACKNSPTISLEIDINNIMEKSNEDKLAEFTF